VDIAFLFARSFSASPVGLGEGTRMIVWRLQDAVGAEGVIE
jgi:hypothetical protein